MNKEEYKRAFAGVGPSAGAEERIKRMAENKKRYVNKKIWVSLFAAVFLLGALAFSADAATDGRLRTGVRLMLSGEKVDLVDFVKNYETYVDENGVRMHRSTIATPDGKHIFWVECSDGTMLKQVRWLAADWEIVGEDAVNVAADGASAGETAETP